MKNTSFNLVATITAGLGLAAATVQGADTGTNNWTSGLVSPVANPINFESPAIGNEVRPIFMYHNLNDKFAIPGNVQVYALQFRLALTERLALIATKDGYVVVNPDAGKSQDGWADIAAGLKYALIDDQESRFLLTTGVKFELPCGSKDVFQGNGDGQFDVFVSAAKGLGDFQLMGSTGVLLPIDGSDESMQLHYSLQLAYPACKWFKPFVALNGYLGLSNGSTPGFGSSTSEGYDLINFGSGDVSGENMLVLGAGFRSSLCTAVDFGFAYEQGVDHKSGIFDNRFTVDLIWKF